MKRINLKDLNVFSFYFTRKSLYDDKWFNNQHIEYIEVINNDGKDAVIKISDIEYMGADHDGHIYKINIPHLYENPLLDILVQKFMRFKDIEYIRIMPESKEKLLKMYKRHIVQYICEPIKLMEKKINAESEKNNDPLMGRYSGS